MMPISSIPPRLETMLTLLSVKTSDDSFGISYEFKELVQLNEIYFNN